jgi:beta-1,4-mannosyl-glycoprotein beta-1,4-N-acetylglucosaminyltransferase
VKIFDCLLFFNEVEALNIRFHELKDVVDYHVIAEGTTTFSGQPRDIGFDPTDPRWAPFIEKVIHVVIDDTPEEAGIWDREAFQRNAVVRGLDLFQPGRFGPLCSAQDLVLISDADEIPSAEAVRWVASRLVRGVAAFELSFHYYHLNQLVCQPSSGDTVDTYEPISWWLARAARRADIRWPQELRDLPLRECAHLAVRGGWHFSYLGGVQRIQAKIAAFSHQELNHPRYTEAANIAGAIKSGRDLFGRDTLHRFQTVTIDESFPAFVVDNQDLFANEIKTTEEPTSNTTLDRGARSVNQTEPGRPITRIIEATYGHGADAVDVTAQVQAWVRNGHLSLIVSNTLFGDPCPNRVKTLRITYEVAGDSRHHRHEVRENRIVSLGR